MKRNLTILRKQTFIWLNPHLEMFTPALSSTPTYILANAQLPPAGLEKPSTPPPGCVGGGRNYAIYRNSSWKFPPHLTNFFVKRLCIFRESSKKSLLKISRNSSEFISFENDSKISLWRSLEICQENTIHILQKQSVFG